MPRCARWCGSFIGLPEQPHGPVFNPYALQVDKLSAHPFADAWNHNTHYYPLLRSLLPHSAERVLDVGCGEGTLCRYLATPGRLVTGVDPDAEVLRESTPGCLFMAASAIRLPFPSSSFDAVTMSMVLHHVDAGVALREAERVLAPGGRILILGYGRSEGWRDALDERRDLRVHRDTTRSLREWDPGTKVAAPSMTWSETRRRLKRSLPGSTYKRLPMWRYLATWDKR